jgi:trigger factor
MTGVTLRALPLACACVAAIAAGCDRPRITYKGLRLFRPLPAPVTDQDVTRWLDRLRDRLAQPVPLPPSTRLRDGHRAVIDFVGTIGGTPFAGGSGTAFRVVLGSGQMIPGFEEGLRGLKAGDQKEIRASFPPDYPEASLAGREAVFRVTVRAVEGLQRPPLDARFAAQVTGGRVTTVAELRRVARVQIEQERAQQAERALRSQVAEAILAQWTKSPGRRAVEKELDRAVQQQIQASAQRGVGPAQGGPDAETLREQLRPGVERTLRLAQATEWIAGREHLVVTDAEVEAQAAQMAQQYGQSPSAFLEMLRQQDGFESLRRQMLEERVFALILQHAEIGTARGPAAPGPS